MDPASLPPTPYVLPSQDQLSHARSKLISKLPTTGLGEAEIQQHLQHDIAPGLNRPSRSPHFYGFVTGGATAAARLADNVVTETDQNVQVHLPNETVCTDVEDAALRMVCDLLRLRQDDWPHRIFSTGATASNVVGLACGREFVLSEAAAFTGQEISVAENGVSESMRKAGIDRVQILTTVPHSSLRKAASVVGLGRACVKDVGREDAPHRFDLAALKKQLSTPKTASIVAVSCAEVNTGWFATNGEEMQQIRDLCDQYGAWLHIDAAFGLLARTLPENASYATIREGVVGMELADSITGDAHKLLNVPYDCGIFLSKHLALGTRVFQNTNAAYLSAEPGAIPSPLNIGLENSRRFRALPVYATLSAYGQAGYKNMLERQISLSRKIATYFSTSSAYDLLNASQSEGEGEMQNIFIVVLFRAKDSAANAELVKRINNTRKIYVSGTQWQGRPAARFAIASWQVDVERDFEVVKGVLDEAAR